MKVICSGADNTEMRRLKEENQHQAKVIRRQREALAAAITCYENWKNQDRIVSYSDPMGFWKVIKKIASDEKG